MSQHRPRPCPRHARVMTLLLTLTLVATLAPAVWAADVEAEGSSGESAAGEHEATTHESAHEAPTIDAKKMALQLFNFGVLVFILVKFGGGAINKALTARHQQLKADLASAAALRAAAEGNLARQEARLGSLEQEIAELRRGIKAEAEAEKARLIAAAEERAQRIKTETAFLVEQQVREAEVKLRRESVDAALKIAEEILRRSIGSDDQKRLIDTFVGNVGETTARQGRPV